MINALALAFLAAILTVGVALPTGAFRAAIVLPIALFLPGHSLVTAILGFRSDRASSLGAVVIGSIAFYVLATLVLAGFSVRLTASSIALAVDVLVFVAAAAILLRFSAATPIDVHMVVRGGWEAAGRVVALVTVAVLVVVATFAARRTFASGPPAHFTQFALAGTSAKLAGAASAESSHLRVELELRNETQERKWFRIAPVLDDTRWEFREVRLEPGQRWTGTVAGAVPPRPCSQRLVIPLDSLRPHYRVTQLALQVNSSGDTCARRAP